jgi:HEPN domain-containing protein
MPEIEKVITVVGEWVKKAENDLKNASYTLQMEDECPTDTVCFHAQQVVEKYLKALLVFKGIPFPKTHDIEDIIAFLPPSSRPRLAEKDQDKLTEYATVTRYPGDYEPISLDEAKKAVRIALDVRRQIRKLLPKPALSRRRKSK